LPTPSYTAGSQLYNIVEPHNDIAHSTLRIQNPNRTLTKSSHTISKNTTTTPNPSSITTPPRLPETPTEPQTALLRLTPSPNYTTIPALLHLTHERPTRRIHNKPVLLNILKPTNIIHLLISSFTPLLSVILTLALHSKLQHTRPTPNNVLHAIDASWRRDSDHTS
jgi:hypothetical protein